jgi:hypothetical protein
MVQCAKRSQFPARPGGTGPQGRGAGAIVRNEANFRRRRVGRGLGDGERRAKAQNEPNSSIADCGFWIADSGSLRPAASAGAGRCTNEPNWPGPIVQNEANWPGGAGRPGAARRDSVATGSQF